MGYHQREIKKGQLGEFSKIVEEIEELLDAHQQSAKMLELCEFCDLLGAIEAYTAKNNITLNDLIQMKNLTKSAFESGDRK